jgi:lysozyme family protein
MQFTPSLREEYRRLFRTAKVKPSRKALVDEVVDRIVAHKPTYKKAGNPIDVPWWVVAVIHELEASGNFKAHLHNGDPLTHRTVHVPAGRPPGNPPFTFAQSARDALEFDGLAHLEDWSISHTLFRLERFNGFGYRKASIDIPSPYLWSFTQHYTRGKFDVDGHYNPALVSQQCGAAALLRVMIDRGQVTPPATTALVHG